MSMLLLPIKVLGWATVGLALGAGWKIGSYLVNAAMADENVQRFMRDFTCQTGRAEEAGEPLWRASSRNSRTLDCRDRSADATHLLCRRLTQIVADQSGTDRIRVHLRHQRPWFSCFQMRGVALIDYLIPILRWSKTAGISAPAFVP